MYPANTKTARTTTSPIHCPVRASLWSEEASRASISMRCSACLSAIERIRSAPFGTASLYSARIAGGGNGPDHSCRCSPIITGASGGGAFYGAVGAVRWRLSSRIWPDRWLLLLVSQSLRRRCGRPEAFSASGGRWPSSDHCRRLPSPSGGHVDRQRWGEAPSWAGSTNP